MALRSPLINVMAGAALKASRKLNRDFGEVENLQVSRKGPADFVSNADRKAEQTIFEELSTARPNFSFLMEERGEVKRENAQGRWIVDPLDGTTNFLHGLPHFAISIAAEEKGKLVAGVIYDPIRDEMFWADRGRGAYLNDRRLRVSARQTLNTALLATGIPWSGRPNHDLFTAQLNAFMPEVAGIRRFGVASLDLAYVAAGRFDGFWEQDLQPWDMAAGILIVREAGGFVTDFGGGEKMLQTGAIVAVNQDLQKPVLKTLRQAARSQRSQS